MSFRYPAFKRAIIMAEKTTAELVIKVDSDGAKLAGENLENLTKTGNKAEKALKKTGKSAGAIGGPFRAMRGSVQQASYQFQDIAVQAQMGTDAFMILGQQGPQLASVFGPGGAVVGAFIAFGAMIAGTLYRTLSGASELTDELTKSTENLYESTDELNGALKQLAILQAAQRQKELEKAVDEANKAMETSKTVIASVALGASVWDSTLEKANNTLIEQQAVIASASEEMKELARQNDGMSDSTEKLLEKLDEELITLGMTNVELTAYKATLAGATEAQIEQAASIQAGIDLKQQDIDRTKEQIKANEKAAKQAEKDAKDAIKREEKLEMFFFKANERKDKEEERAAEKLARDKAAAVQAATNTANLGLNELDAMQVKHEALELEHQRHLDEGLISEQKHAEALKGIEREKAVFAQSQLEAKLAIDQQALASASNVVGQLAGIAEQGSKEARVLFAIQKALAIAQIIVATEQAAALASVFAAGGGPLAWLASREGIRVMGYASAGIVAGTAIAGGRALGGQVSGGNSYLVGERGPELLTMGTSGRIATNENLKKAVNGDNSNSSNVINVNFSVQANDTAGFDRLLQSRRGQIVGMINQAVNNRGRSSIV